MDLSLVGTLLRELTSPLEFEKLWLFFGLSLELLDSKLLLLVVPDLELVVGLVPRIVAVSLEQYRAHGVPDWSPKLGCEDRT